MRVAYAIHSLESGGAQRQAVEMAAWLGERGDVDPVFFVYRDDDFFGPRLRDSAIEVHRIPKSWTLDLGFPLRVSRWLERQAVDVVHAYLHPPSLWSLLALRCMRKDRRPALIASERNCLIATSLQQRLLQRFIYQGADAVTANAFPVVAEIERKCGVSPGHVHYIPNGIDLARWDREAARPLDLEMDPARFHVALVGRLVPQKNPLLLIEALSRIGVERLRDWRIWLIGDDALGLGYSQTVRREAERAGLADRISFIPPRRDIAAILRRLDLLVLPSDFEGFPNVVLEAMASGVPVVSSAVGDVPNLVEHEKTGQVVPARDPDALAEALCQIHDSGPERRRDMGAAGREKVERQFQLQTIAEAYLELYHAVAPSSRRGG